MAALGETGGLSTWERDYKVHKTARESLHVLIQEKSARLYSTHSALTLASVDHSPSITLLFYKILFIDFREMRGGKEGEKARERNIDLFFHLFMYSLVASCMCPDWRLNLQPWCVRTG